MESFIACALLVIASILFYRFVERRHKVILAKVIGGLVAAAGATAFSAFYVERRSDRLEANRQAQVLVTHIDPRKLSIEGIPSSVALVDGFRDDTVSAVTFEICNESSSTLTGIRFWPQTLHSGRSTEYAVRLGARDAYGYTSNDLLSDYILQPGQCTEAEWSKGPFRLLDTVTVHRKVATFAPQ